MNIHDYRKEKCNWYHKLMVLNPSHSWKFRCRGCGKGIVKDDAIILSLNHFDHWAAYRVVSINYLIPEDVFAAELEIWPEIINEKQEEFEQAIGGKIAIR